MSVERLSKLSEALSELALLLSGSLKTSSLFDYASARLLRASGTSGYLSALTLKFTRLVTDPLSL